ncbi:MAG: hypothetical protein JXQ87_11760 [Bacteroidia bacterium]
MRQLLLASILLSLLGNANAQERPTLDIHGFFDMGWVVGPSHENAKLDYLISVDYTPGIRLLKPIWQHGDLAIELSYHNVHYHLNQNDQKLLPNNILHDRERFYIHVLNLGLGHRYYLNNGLYFDIGFNFDWNFRNVHMIKNPDSNGEDVKTFDRSITYFNPVNFDVLARVGKGRWTLHYIHRMTPLIKPDVGLPTLPSHILGIGLRI